MKRSVLMTLLLLTSLGLLPAYSKPLTLQEIAQMIPPDKQYSGSQVVALLGEVIPPYQAAIQQAGEDAAKTVTAELSPQIAYWKSMYTTEQTQTLAIGAVAVFEAVAIAVGALLWAFAR